MRLGQLADRMSVNIELPTQKSLELLAPDKTKTSILRPMGLITGKIQETRTDLVRYRHVPRFAPAGQSTQMIVGATEDTDYRILTLSEALYKKYRPVSYTHLATSNGSRSRTTRMIHAAHRNLADRRRPAVARTIQMTAVMTAA